MRLYNSWALLLTIFLVIVHFAFALENIGTWAPPCSCCSPCSWLNGQNLLWFNSYCWFEFCLFVSPNPNPTIGILWSRRAKQSLLSVLSDPIIWSILITRFCISLTPYNFQNLRLWQFSTHQTCLTLFYFEFYFDKHSCSEKCLLQLAGEMIRQSPQNYRKDTLYANPILKLSLIFYENIWGRISLQVENKESNMCYVSDKLAPVMCGNKVRRKARFCPLQSFEEMDCLVKICTYTQSGVFLDSCQLLSLFSGNSCFSSCIFSPVTDLVECLNIKV